MLLRESGCTSSARTWSCTASSGCQSGSCFDSLSLFLIDTCVWFERTRQSATQQVVFIFYVFSQTTSSSANVMDIASTWWDVLSTSSSRHRGDVVDVFVQIQPWLFPTQRQFHSGILRNVSATSFQQKACKGQYHWDSAELLQWHQLVVGLPGLSS